MEQSQSTHNKKKMQSPKDQTPPCADVMWVNKEVMLKVDDATTTVNCSNDKTVIDKTPEIHHKDPKGSVHESDDAEKLFSVLEPGVIEKLSSGYQVNEIYRYIGKTLIATNPFKRMPNLYNFEKMEEYNLGEQSPHPYAVADSAYRLMLSEVRSQTILVSGISGSGKTRVSELTVRYLEYVGGKAASEGRDVEKKLLQYNTILEAFGSAKTKTNDNSSRFGKFVEVQFDQKGKISGAFIRTSCLERSRVCHISNQERNYHCFYMLCAAPPKETEKYELAEPTSFHYLNQSNCFEIKGVDDSESYERIIEAMETIGISSSEQNSIFRIVAAILHLGNVEFAAGNDECPMKIKDKKSRFNLTATATLLMCEEKELEHSLYVTSKDKTVKDLDLNAANGRRDELAQILYSRLFDWLVNKINSSMGQDPKSKCFIGVHEEIVWNYTGFTDNQEVINPVEKVTYQAQFFMDNNKAPLLKEQHILLSASKCSIVAELFPPLSSKSSKSLSADCTEKIQSQSLLDTMSATGAHYIRCVKPNSESTAGTFDNEYVLLQLRYGRDSEILRTNLNKVKEEVKLPFEENRTLDEAKERPPSLLDIEKKHRYERKHSASNGLASLDNEVPALKRDREIAKTNLNKAEKEAKLSFEESRTVDKPKERLPSLRDKDQKHRSERKRPASSSTKIRDGIIQQSHRNDSVVDIEHGGLPTTITTNNNSNSTSNDQELSEDEEPTELDRKDKAVHSFLKPVSITACTVLNTLNFGSFALVGSAGYPGISDAQKYCIVGGLFAFLSFSLLTIIVVHAVEHKPGDINFATIMVFAEMAYVFVALCLVAIFFADASPWLIIPLGLVALSVTSGWLAWRYHRPRGLYNLLKKCRFKPHMQ